MAYTAGDINVRAVMEAYTGMPEDRIVNDFAFHFPAAPSAGDLTTAFGWVDDFYNVVQASGRPVAEFISDYVPRTATHTLQAYSILDGGPPIREDPWLGPVACNHDGVPTEVAGVLSFHSDLFGIGEFVGGTRPRARRRGRLYIGPLCILALNMDAPPFLLDSDQFLPTIRQAGVALLTAAGGAWSVWSRADETLREVVGGWTDNAPDTQRRRGPTSNSRVTWS